METNQIPVKQQSTTAPFVPEPVTQAHVPVTQKSSNLPIIVLSIFLAISLSAIAYLYNQIQFLKYQPTPTPGSQVAPSPVTTPTISPSPTTPTSEDLTVTWKTYNNNLFGFSFKYPTDYSLNDKLQKSTDPSSWTTKNSIVLENSINECSMWLMVNPDGFGPFFPNKYLTSQYNSDKGFVITKETSNSENLTPNIYSVMLMGEISTKTTNGLIASGTCPDTSSNRNYLDKTFTQILSTFKFTN